MIKIKSFYCYMIWTFLIFLFTIFLIGICAASGGILSSMIKEELRQDFFSQIFIRIYFSFVTFVTFFGHFFGM